MLNQPIRNGLVRSGDSAARPTPGARGRPTRTHPARAWLPRLPPARRTFPAHSSLQFLSVCWRGCCLSHSVLNTGNKISKMELSFVFNSGKH